MSTIKSSAENLTLNADGANNDIIFQSNGTTKATLDQAGLLTATSFAGSGANLTGVGVDGISSSANATAMTIDSAENIGIGTTPESGQGSNSQGLYVGTHASLTSNGAYESVNLSENAYLATAASDAWKYRDTSHAARHEMKAGVHTLKVAASGSADAAITWNTGFEVLNDGKARAKNGLLFGTDTATANTLDDYEEGTWTAAFEGATFSGGNRTGYYTKVGNLVNATVYVGATTISNVTAAGKITGIPYNMASLANHYAVGAYVHGNAATGIQNLYLDYSNNKMYPTAKDSTSSVDWVAGSGKHLMVSVTYRTA